MATRAQEIDTIGDLLASVGATRYYKENFPTTYATNTIGIRWQGDTPIGRTAAFYEVTRTYQIVYFGASRVDCLTKSEIIHELISEHIDKKVKIRGLDEFITLGSFVMTPSFKTDTDGVFAVSGILTTTVRKAHKQPVYDKMRVINAAINEGGN